MSWKDSHGIEKSTKRVVAVLKKIVLNSDNPCRYAMLWQCPDKRGTRLGLWRLLLPRVWHDARCTTAPYSCLQTTMSSRRFSWLPLLVHKKFKKSKTVVSNEHQIRLCKLLDNLLRTAWGTAWEWTCERLGNERVYLYGGPSFGEGGGERINSYPAILCWHISAYRNRLKMNK